MKPLGKTQTAMLRSIREHNTWYPGCGWIWGNRSETIRLLDSLVKRGLVTKEERTTHTSGGGFYKWPYYKAVK